MSQVTLITGARKGIGRFLTEHYLACGHSVIGCSRSESDLKHERYFHICGDITQEAFVKSLMQHIRQQFGVLDNVINNAGIASMNHALLTP